MNNEVGLLGQIAIGVIVGLLVAELTKGNA